MLFNKMIDWDNFSPDKVKFKQFEKQFRDLLISDTKSSEYKKNYNLVLKILKHMTYNIQLILNNECRNGSMEKISDSILFQKFSNTLKEKGKLKKTFKVLEKSFDEMIQELPCIANVWKCERIDNSLIGTYQLSKRINEPFTAYTFKNLKSLFVVSGNHSIAKAIENNEGIVDFDYKHSLWEIKEISSDILDDFDFNGLYIFWDDEPIYGSTDGLNIKEAWIGYLFYALKLCFQYDYKNDFNYK